jgi:hypothetical protein
MEMMRGYLCSSASEEHRLNMIRYEIAPYGKAHQDQGPLRIAPAAWAQTKPYSSLLQAKVKAQECLVDQTIETPCGDDDDQWKN